MSKMASFSLMENNAGLFSVLRYQGISGDTQYTFTAQMHKHSFL
jgi:hypothetical protein